MALAALVAVALVGVGFLRFVSRSGHEVAQAQATVVGQIDRAKDVQAQATAHTAVQAAAAVYAESGSFADAGPAQLSAFDPSLTWVDGASSAPNIVGLA